MTGRQVARRLLGLTPSRAQPKGWDYPETPEDLERLTGLTWRPLDFQPKNTGHYAPMREWVRWRPEDQDPLWDRAWATRHDGWLIIYDTEEMEGELWVADIDKVALPEADRATMERIVGVARQLNAEAFLIETDDPRLPYVIVLPLFQDLSLAFGVGPEPHVLDEPAHLLWEMRLVQRIIDALQESL